MKTLLVVLPAAFVGFGCAVAAPTATTEPTGQAWTTAGCGGAPESPPEQGGAGTGAESGAGGVEDPGAGGAGGVGDPGTGAGGGAAPQAPGTAKKLTTPCTLGAGEIPGTSCVAVEVSCPGIESLTAEVRVSPPTGGKAVLGTVVLGTGGGGIGFGDVQPPVVEMITALRAKGYQIVRRRWTGKQGWLAGSAGAGALSCRYATLVTWIHDNVHVGGAFCAAGNSGGSAEIAYALARWGRSAILDHVVMASGPPMARIDYGCLADPADPWWSQCQSLEPSTAACPTECAYNAAARNFLDATYAPATPCSTSDAAMAATMHADSVLAPGAALHYPTTFAQFLFGAEDCTVSVPLGKLYAQAVTSPKAVETVAGVPHVLISSAAGAAATQASIEKHCVP
jgi:hypothetical protein